MLPELTTRQVILRLRAAGSTGFADLSNSNLRNVELLDTELHDLLLRITGTASQEYHNKTIYVDLTGSNISGLDFRNLNLSGTIMSNVMAAKTIFAQSNLSDTQLDNADISYADFRESDLTYTKLFGTKIKGTNFAGANLQKTLGLGFSGDKQLIISRLSEASSITKALLPPQVEAIRDRIQALIKNHGHHVKSPAPMSSWQEESILETS